VTPDESYPAQHPWIAVLLLGTVATPAGIVLGWLVSRPLDAVVALPLVLVDLWAAQRVSPGPMGTPLEPSAFTRLLLLALGMVLTWAFYVLVARVALWRLAPRAPDG
jgi:hypothetical protein